MNKVSNLNFINLEVNLMIKTHMQRKLWAADGGAACYNLAKVQLATKLSCQGPSVYLAKKFPALHYMLVLRNSSY